MPATPDTAPPVIDQRALTRAKRAWNKAIGACKDVPDRDLGPQLPALNDAKAAYWAAIRSALDTLKGRGVSRWSQRRIRELCREHNRVLHEHSFAVRRYTEAYGTSEATHAAA